MRKLATLIRLKKRELDEIRSRMVKLENRRDHYIAQVEQLAEDLKREYEMAGEMMDMRGFFGDFADSIKKRQQILAAHIVQTETQIQQLATEVQAQFSELKKYEIAKEQFDAAELKQQRKKEQLEMDEIGIRNAVFFESSS